MTEREYLVINVSYGRKDRIAFVSANYRMIFSNIRKDKLEAYLNELNDDGWELIRVDTLNNGWNQAYYFVRSKE